jgi:hypothetical protein
VKKDPRGRWVKGLAHWREGETAFISVAFTWLLREAAKVADYYTALGCKVRAGGPAIFAVHNRIVTGRHLLSGKVELGGQAPDAVNRHNPMATRASFGCPEECVFCMVPAFEGREFTFVPEFPVRPVLIDNNLSGLPRDYQDHIIERYVGHGVRIVDANSGFEPKSFDEDCFERWSTINDGPWRFGFDETKETDVCETVMRMLRRRKVPPKLIRPYVIIGNEPFEECMARIRKVIEWGGEPHVQDPHHETSNHAKTGSSTCAAAAPAGSTWRSISGFCGEDEANGRWLAAFAGAREGEDERLLSIETRALAHDRRPISEGHAAVGSTPDHVA